MLQNRVDPLGHLIRTPARGAWMGNRGLLHDERREIVRPYKLKAWLICVLAFKGRQRMVMTPNRYTELFFLDEATAFSAGHRPCFECRREAAQRFRSAWVRGNPSYDLTERTSIDELDVVLHTERLQQPGVYMEVVSQLPSGVFVLYEDKPHLVAAGALHLWSPFGYSEPAAAPAFALPVITPRSTVNAFRMGYVPQMGPFAILATERLLIRQLGPNDWPEVYAMNSSAAVMQSIASGRIRPIEEEKASFQRILNNYEKGNGLGVWAVVLRADGRFIGAGSLTELEDTGEIQVGYRFKQEHWGQGYATEVARALVDYGFRQLRLSRIVATANVTNTASQRVLEKAGLQWEKRAFFHQWEVNYFAASASQIRS